MRLPLRRPRAGEQPHERRREPRELPKVSAETRAAVERLPDDFRRAIELAWRDMAGFARYNGNLVWSLRRLLIRVLVVLAVVIPIILAISLGTGFLSLRLQSERHHDTQQSIKQKTEAIQTARYDSILHSCQALNQRHRRASRIASGAGRAVGPAGEDLATALIGVLAPLRDGRHGRQTCAAYATQQLQPRGPKPPAPPPA